MEYKDCPYECGEERGHSPNNKCSGGIVEYVSLN